MGFDDDPPVGSSVALIVSGLIANQQGGAERPGEEFEMLN